MARDALDITDPERVSELVAEVRPAVVINCAAYTKVDLAEKEASLAEEVNARSPGLLARVCNDVGALLVHYSTDYVFDGSKASPYVEDDEPNPASVYGSTKLAGEKAASDAKDHLILRTSWVFGDGRNFVSTIVEAARSRGQISVVDDQIGRLSYAPDIAAATLQLLRAGARGLFHLTGGGPPASWADVAELAIRYAGVAATVERISTERFFEGRSGPVAPRPANSVLDCAKAEGLGASLRDWREALAEYLAS